MDHFGYRDRLSQPVIKGTGEMPTLGSGAPLKAGEFILGPLPICHSRKFFLAMAATWAYRRLQEHVGKFRDFLREHGQTREEHELLAAKLMGRWRSGAPLVLAPDKDDSALAADMRSKSRPMKKPAAEFYGAPSRLLRPPDGSSGKDLCGDRSF
jgi:hypothetical protein